jgi:hypothetical protein
MISLTFQALPYDDVISVHAGNMNRQFVSLLRSEQDANFPVIGNAGVWEKLLGADAELMKLQGAFDPKFGGDIPTRNFPYWQMIKWVYRRPSKWSVLINNTAN